MKIFRTGALYELEGFYRVFEYKETLAQNALAGRFNVFHEASVFQYLLYDEYLQAYVLYWIERETRCIIPSCDLNDRHVKEITE